MPYLILVVGLLVALFAFYSFFMKANTAQIKNLFLSAALLTLCAAMFFLAVTGRLPAALALVASLFPFVVAYLNVRARKSAVSPPPAGTGAMDVAEALRVLNLSEGASTQDIKDAYKKLMLKVHPDQQGSEWMAAKLNEARDLLLRKQG